MFKASLSNIQLNQYLMMLTESDLLRHDKQTYTFKTTEKGLSLLKAYNQMGQIIKEREI
jgi:predicted transcriptional regulator